MSKTTASSREALASAFDLKTLLKRIELPGVDLGKLIDSRRKDIEALVAANREAVRAIAALGKLQQEILANAMKSWQEGAREAVATPTLKGKASKSAEQTRAAFGQALTDLRTIAEAALKANQQVLGVLNARLQERLEESGLKRAKANGKVVAEPVADGSPKAVPPSRRRAAKTVTPRKARAPRSPAA